MVSGLFPKWIVLQLLRQCNLNCRMCYEWGPNGAYTEKDKSARLSLEVIRSITEESAPYRPHFELFGGEPFLYPQIDEVVRLIKSSGSSLHIPTNGTLLKHHCSLLVDMQVDLIWISLDGPQLVNDAQRGEGVFAKTIQGINAIHELKQKKGTTRPELGITFVLTPDNSQSILDFFINSIDLEPISRISIEFTNYITEETHKKYLGFLNEHYDIKTARYAEGFIRNPNDFRDMKFGLISDQIEEVRKVCRTKNIKLITRPRNTNKDNIQRYFSGAFHKMSDQKSSCPLPFLCLEVAATGQVTTCHCFYDLTMGNVQESSIKTIWNGTSIKENQILIGRGLLPICTGCCHYHM